MATSPLFAEFLRQMQSNAQGAEQDATAYLNTMLANTADQPAIPYSLPALPSPITAGAQALLSNTASAVSGNPMFSMSNTRQFENVMANRMQAEGQKAGLDYNQAFQNRQNVFNLRANELQRQYDAAKSMGQHAYAAELLEQQYKIQKDIAADQNRFQSQQDKLQRENALNVARVHAGAGGKLRPITGDEALDKVLRLVEAQQQLTSAAFQAFHASGQKDYKKFLKESVWGGMLGSMQGILDKELVVKKPGAAAATATGPQADTRLTRGVEQSQDLLIKYLQSPYGQGFPLGFGSLREPALLYKYLTEPLPPDTTSAR